MSAARVVWAVVLVAGLAAGAPILVEPRGDVDTLHAERYALDARFRVASTALDRAFSDMAPSGAPGSPVEITEAGSPARTAARAGDALFVVTLFERLPDSVPDGTYVVSLRVDGILLAEAHLAQDVPNPLAQEGARIAFALGPEEPVGALFSIQVARPALDEIVLTSAFDAQAADYVWHDEEGRTNATIDGTLGEPMRFRAVNGEGTAAHNLRILSPSGKPLAMTEDVETPGQSVVLDFTPEEAGSHVYQCRYHSKMKGTLQVKA